MSCGAFWVLWSCSDLQWLFVVYSRFLQQASNCWAAGLGLPSVVVTHCVTKQSAVLACTYVWRNRTITQTDPLSVSCFLYSRTYSTKRKNSGNKSWTITNRSTTSEEYSIDWSLTMVDCTSTFFNVFLNSWIRLLHRRQFTIKLIVVTDWLKSQTNLIHSLDRVILLSNV